jgi:hypothetical protein
MFALAALTAVTTAALSTTSASAAWGHGFGGDYRGGSNHLGYRGWYHWGYPNYGYYSPAYGSYWYYRPVYSLPTAPVYSAPLYSAPTPPIAVNQKVYVEANYNGGPASCRPERAASAAVRTAAWRGMHHAPDAADLELGRTSVVRPFSTAPSRLQFGVGGVVRAGGKASLADAGGPIFCSWSGLDGFVPSRPSGQCLY